MVNATNGERPDTEALDNQPRPFGATIARLPGRNPLVADNDAAQTIENAAAVLVFLQEWNTRLRSAEFNDEAAYDLSLTLDALRDALKHSRTTIRRGQ